MILYVSGFAGREIRLKKEQRTYYFKEIESCFFSGLSSLKLELNNSFRLPVQTVRGTQHLAWLVWKGQQRAVLGS